MSALSARGRCAAKKGEEAIATSIGSKCLPGANFVGTTFGYTQKHGGSLGWQCLKFKSQGPP
jgi:hypothetical protein